MNKIMFFLMFLILAPFASASDLSVRLISIDPPEVTPGNLFSITFEATNIGNNIVRDTDFRLSLPESFNLEGSSKINFDEISPKEKVTLSWLIKADKLASSGFEKIELEVENSKNQFSVFYPVKINTLEPTLIIDNFFTKPEQVAPGSEVLLNIRLSNVASFELKNIEVSLDLSKTPFSPIKGVDKETVNQLIRNSIVTKQINLIVDSNAEAGVYKIPLKLNYFDEFGTKYSKDAVISIKIGSTPRIEISQESSKLIIGEKSEATIKLVNNGLTKIKLLTINLEAINTELISSNNIYLGDLDVDDFQTIDVELFSQNNGASLTLKLNFKDANNNDFSETVNIPLKVYSREEAKKIGIIQESNSFIYMLILVVALLAYFVYRKIKRK